MKTRTPFFAVGSMLLAQLLSGTTMKQSSMSSQIEAVVLAAGRSSRFKSHGNKLIAPLCGQELLLYPLQMLSDLGIKTTLVLSPYGAPIREVVDRSGLSNIAYHTQQTPGGTGHAVKCTQELWSKDHILILNGDTPLVTSELVQALYAEHIAAQAAVSFVTCYVDDPSRIAYGRVIAQGDSYKIVEQKDCTPEELTIKRVNAGIYLVKRAFLSEVVNFLQPSSASGEIYITDIVGFASFWGNKVVATTVPFDAIRGVNKLDELAHIEYVKRAQLVAYWQERGVRFMDPRTTYLDFNVTIGEGSVIGAGVHLLNGACIGKGVHVGPYAIIDNTHIADGVWVPSHVHAVKQASDVQRASGWLGQTSGELSIAD